MGKRDEKHAPPSLMSFFVGIVLLGAGLFWFSHVVTVSSNFFGGMIGYFGRFSLPGGAVLVPLIIGIVWLFAQPRSLLPKIVIVLGAVFVLLSVILSVRLVFERQTLFATVMMLGMIAAGGGLCLRTLFHKG